MQFGVIDSSNILQFFSKSRCKQFGVVLPIFCKSFLKVTFGFQFNKVQNSMFVFSSKIESIFSKHSFQVNMSKQFCEIHSSKSGLWIQLDQFNSILWIPYGFNYRHQTLNGPFSPVSTPIFASKCALESAWRDLQIPPSSRELNFQNFQNLWKSSISRIFWKISAEKSSKFSTNFDDFSAISWFYPIIFY